MVQCKSTFSKINIHPRKGLSKSSNNGRAVQGVPGLLPSNPVDLLKLDALEFRNIARNEYIAAKVLRVHTYFKLPIEGVISFQGIGRLQTRSTYAIK